MCGIFGVVSLGDRPFEPSAILEEMGELLRHRGPDAHGIHFERYGALGAERLRVHDPTAAGDQPLTDRNGRLSLVFNGALYNAADIRHRYQGYPYRSSSDAEVLMPLFERRGIDCVTELDGMFAFAIYDAEVRELTLVRDRAGEKPLFYSRVGSEVWFASEVQALLAHPRVSRELDAAAMQDYVTLGYVTEPRTLFSSIRRIRAGTCLTLSPSGEREHRYWSPAGRAVCRRNLDEARKELEALLTTAVAKQSSADVAVGVFTSGGLDSSLLTALSTRSIEPRSLKTFSVGFDVPSFDESGYARRLASHLKTRHFTAIADEPALEHALHTMIDTVAEPIADPAALPTLILARLAKDHVTVVLAGEGADELFGGYPTYVGHRFAPWFEAAPEVLTRALARLAHKLPTSQGRKMPLEYLFKRFVDGVALPLPDRHTNWFGTGATGAVLHPDSTPAHYDPPAFPETGDAVARAGEFDFCTYLRDNLLPKVDRATMHASVEARAPYLDKDVVEFGLSLDTRFKVRGITTKWLLKKVARRMLPRSFVYRKKRGLSVPVASWLNGGLQGEVDRLLEPGRLERQGLLHRRNVGQLLTEHRSGRVNHGRLLWPLVVLQYWLERWVPERCL